MSKKHKKKIKNTLDTKHTMTATNDVAQNDADEKAIKGMRIAIAILLVFAIIMALVVFIPPKGELTSTLTGTDFNGEGDAMRVRVDINNDTNKPAFNVQYEIIVKATDGTVLGTSEGTILMMFPGGTRHLEKFIYFDTAVDTGDVEVNLNGYVVGE